MSSPILWPSRQVAPPLHPGTVHVWAWPLACDEDELAGCVRLLDAAEAERMQAFRFARDQRRFAVAHAGLRSILGQYQQQPPEMLRFLVSPLGKPALASTNDGPRVAFNLSHTEELAVLAVALGDEAGGNVGADVEAMQAVESAVAESFFSPAELAQLRELGREEWRLGFYRAWTRKEALLKAEGLGLNLPLDAFDVSLLPGAPAELVAVREPARFTQLWKLYELAPTADTIGAVATVSAVEPACFRYQLSARQ